MNSRRRVLALIFGSLILALVAGSVITVWVTASSIYDDFDADLDDDLERSIAYFSLLEVVVDVGESTGAELDLAGLRQPASEDIFLLYSATGELTESSAGGENLDISGPDIIGNVDRHFSAAGPDGDFRVGATRIDGGPGRAVLALARPLDETALTIDRLVTALFFTMVGVLVVLALLVWWIVRVSLRPIEEMIETAQTIASGDFDRRAELVGTDPDMARLGGALNTMLDQVQTSFTEKEATEARLKRFVSDASHELRTPLTTVRGYSELYLSGAATDPESVTKQMHRINSEATRMGTLVDDLLTLVRLDQGRGLDLGVVDASSLVENGVADAQVVDPGRNITFDRPNSAMTVLGDEDRLLQVVTNLLANAREHTPDGTSVEVNLKRENGHVVIAIHDDGPGMDPAAAKHVFDRFFRAEDSRNRAKGGAGLGLAIAKSVVDAHGGTIAVDSSPGNGATFTVSLPHHPPG